MPSEKELLNRIRELEEMNSALQDKLDMIYAIVSPEFEEGVTEEDDEDDENPTDRLVQIDGMKSGRKAH